MPRAAGAPFAEERGRVLRVARSRPPACVSADVGAGESHPAPHHHARPCSRSAGPTQRRHDCRVAVSILVLLDTDVEVGPRFRNHCASSTRVGGRSRLPVLWCCYNAGLSARRRQPPFRRRAGVRPRSSSALLLATDESQGAGQTFRGCCRSLRPVAAGLRSPPVASVRLAGTVPARFSAVFA